MRDGTILSYRDYEKCSRFVSSAGLWFGYFVTATKNPISPAKETRSKVSFRTIHNHLLVGTLVEAS